MRFVQTGDLHLGARFSKLGNKANKQRKRLLTTFSTIINFSIKENADALLICGDLFDSCFPNPVTIDTVISEFNKLRKENIPVFIVPGNHDFGDKNPYDCSLFPSNVKIFTNSKMESFDLGEWIIHGCAFNYQNPDADPLKAFEVKKPEKINVGIVHGSYTKFNWAEEEEKAYAPIDKKDIENSGLTYLALGHFHKTSQLDTKIPAWYAGTPEPLSFSQAGESNILLVETTEETVKVQKQKTNETTYKLEEIDLTQNQNRAFEILKQNADINTSLRLTLKGTPANPTEIDADSLVEHFQDDYFYLEINDQTHIPMNEIPDASLRGRFIRLMQESIKNEKNGQEMKVKELAYRIGLRALDGKL
ncbi:MAG: DNA repair exonuclease [Candidatus Micrarchaeota archaeon]